MFTIKNRNGQYYTEYGWSNHINGAKVYEINGAKKSAERHNGKVVEVIMCVGDDGTYQLTEK